MGDAAFFEREIEKLNLSRVRTRLCRSSGLAMQADAANVLRIPPLHISKESISCMSSTHVFPTYWRPARTVIVFASEELWLKRTRGYVYVETIVSLVSCAGAKLDQFADLGQPGDIVRLLGKIGVDQKVWESSSVGQDRMFVMCWTWPFTGGHSGIRMIRSGPAQPCGAGHIISRCSPLSHWRRTNPDRIYRDFLCCI